MYLKALEIQGFKSFPDRTRLTFEKDVTAIVGPNGSGKSNISDAILWVMGEQSSKTLRGNKMEDVIFGGTALRTPMGYAEVSLVIDNSARIFDTESSEIELSRRYYRSGESEYYINRESVRLKDINSLLMDTGLGRDGYSIIGQGKIADIVSTKSSDRREVFDEAAGISRYRYRKEEAERRLEKTEENLLRINDKIEELELQVGPLKQQSETAKKYLAYRDELREREVSAWMETLERLHEKAESVKLEYEQSTLALSKAKSDLESLYASSESISDRMQRKDEESESVREKLSAKEAEAAEISSSIEVIKANIASNDEAVERLLGDIEAQSGRQDEIRKNISESEMRIDEIDKDLKNLSEKIEENSNIISGSRMKIQSREDALAKASDKVNAVSVKYQNTQSRANLLDEMEKDFEGYSKAVRTVMRESSRGVLKGVHGPVANLIKADDDVALAIETALGAAAQNIVIDSRELAKSAIEYLKRNDGGRCTFLPLDTIRGRVIPDAPENEKGYVGVAYDLVSYDGKYEEIVASILGATLVVETLGDAIAISRKNKDRFKIVTLDGQMINPGGSMTGGSASKNAGIISRANELEKLRGELSSLLGQIHEAESALQKARNDLSSARYDLEAANEIRNELSSDESSLKAEKTAVQSSIAQFKILLDGISDDSKTRESAVERAKDESRRLAKLIEDKEALLKSAQEKIEEIKKEIEDISKARIELEGKRVKNANDTKARFEEITDLERRVARIEGKKANADLEEKQIMDKLWDNYELSFTRARELAKPVDNLSKLNKEISEIKSNMNALGTPNIGAIEEYERVSERYDFLTNQRDDVESAKKDLLGIISDVTSEMENVFLTQFKLINEEFMRTFKELFGGGNASVELEDENNILECGIEIKVQPPGKQVNTISLLSGGEKAFVAIALYFAILKVRPTPFCVMDEIEAALDEANVSRFAEYMRDMSQRTQFLVITHRRGTMEEADMLYGVTMQEKGVSAILELNLEEAKKAVEN